MNRQININQTLTEQLSLIFDADQTAVPGAWFNGTTATSDNVGIVNPSATDDYTISIFGVTAGTATVHIETTVHFTQGETTYTQTKSIDLVFDCTPEAPATSLKVTP